MLEAIVREVKMRRSELPSQPLQTIYFGGGTPSLLDANDLGKLFDAIGSNFDVATDAEITLEANPDDLTREKIRELRNSPVNRLSIGIQSFRDSDLLLMNRAHTSQEAERSVKTAQDAGITNITCDLIYGLPDQSLSDWRENVRRMIALDVPHISSYCLTVEPRTALAGFVQKGRVRPAGEQIAADHFHLLADETERAGYEHYEISNFAKRGFISRHNSSYWKGEPYLGVGPSAHSYDGKTRRWNVANNATYLKNISEGKTTYEEEVLSDRDRFNEMIMLGLRAKWGVDQERIKSEFGDEYYLHLVNGIQKHLKTGHLIEEGKYLHLTREGKFLSDGIASDLFLV